jgi:hypothetical protein
VNFVTGTDREMSCRLQQTSEMMHEGEGTVGYFSISRPVSFFLFHKMNVELLIKFFVAGKDGIIMHMFSVISSEMAPQSTLSVTYRRNT